MVLAQLDAGSQGLRMIGKQIQPVLSSRLMCSCRVDLVIHQWAHAQCLGQLRDL